MYLSYTEVRKLIHVFIFHNNQTIKVHDRIVKFDSSTNLETLKNKMVDDRLSAIYNKRDFEIIRAKNEIHSKFKELNPLYDVVSDDEAELWWLINFGIYTEKNKSEYKPVQDEKRTRSSLKKINVEFRLAIESDFKKIKMELSNISHTFILSLKGNNSYNYFHDLSTTTKRFNDIKPFVDSEGNGIDLTINTQISYLQMSYLITISKRIIYQSRIFRYNKMLENELTDQYPKIMDIRTYIG